MKTTLGEILHRQEQGFDLDLRESIVCAFWELNPDLSDTFYIELADKAIEVTNDYNHEQLQR